MIVIAFMFGINLILDYFLNTVNNAFDSILNM